MISKPFLKWAGGKSQLLDQMGNLFPKELHNGAITRYIEPFIGGGSVFLYIAQKYEIEEFFIYDINAELVVAYLTIQNSVEELIAILLEIKNKYLSLNEDDRNKYFYQVRSQFNWQRQYIDLQKYNKEWIERTAQIIFLNHTCFNGLFRVNSKGDFNVPVGKYKNPTIYDPKNLRALSQVLQKVIIRHGDFSECEDLVNQYSLVYFDPPYRPISKTSKFTSYSQQTFDDAEQLRLRDFFKLLDSRGAKLILSNSDPKNEDPNDNFFELAYEGYRITRVKAARNINSNALKESKLMRF